MNDPQYYIYGYTQTGDPTTVGGVFEATAEGDLDGDAVYSTFTMRGGIQADGAALTATLGPNLEEANPDE